MVWKQEPRIERHAVVWILQAIQPTLFVAHKPESSIRARSHDEPQQGYRHTSSVVSVEPELVASLVLSAFFW